MRPWLTWLLAVQHPDPDVQRRGRTALVLALSLLATASAFGFLILGDPNRDQASLPIILVLVVSILLMVGAIRQGWVTGGITVLVTLLVLAISISMLQHHAVGVSPFYLLVPVLLASVTLPAQWLGGVLVLTYTGLALVVAWLPATIWLDPSTSTILQGGCILVAIAAFTGYLGARSVETALRTTRAAHHVAAQAAAALEALNRDLEARVAARTADLAQALHTQEAHAGALAASLERQQALHTTMLALSVPVIPVAPDVLVVPLVGTLDVVRGEQLVQTILQALEGGTCARSFWM